jgi:hypothetical protein
VTTGTRGLERWGQEERREGEDRLEWPRTRGQEERQREEGERKGTGKRGKGGEDRNKRIGRRGQEERMGGRKEVRE